MTEIKIADLLYVQKANIALDDFVPWLCILVKNQYMELSYSDIEKKVIPKMLDMVGIHRELAYEDVTHGIDLVIPLQRYVEFTRKGIDETGYGRWMRDNPSFYIPSDREHLQTSDGTNRFRPAMTMMRVGILVEILEKDPEAVIVVD